ncbi:hypothetical protein F4778DRAFT_716752 [Xylariomycetidae sp. FL2044]|nr:hypothetical protein F4778DRAFT_716752 [Xylariomycetidae sp. FL2044]
MARYRDHQRHRAFAVTDGASTQVISTEPKAWIPGPGVLFVFTGQGTQWAGMSGRLPSRLPSILLGLEIMYLALS